MYFRVMEPKKAVLVVQDFLYATSQLAQTTLRSTLGEVELDDLLSEREKLNLRLQEIIDRRTDSWGIKVQMVEMKHVDLPENMQRAIAKQAEAERERRAKVIHAEGEYQAADKLLKAADIISTNPQALQLRFLGTLAEIATEQNSTIIFPLPLAESFYVQKGKNISTGNDKKQKLKRTPTFKLSACFNFHRNTN